jgi:hypothetical protein
MKNILLVLGLTSTIFFAQTVFAKDINCISQSNGDYELTLSVNSNGRAETVTLVNTDWGGYGQGIAQKLQYIETHNTYDIVSEGLPQIGLNTGLSLLIEENVTKGLSGEISVITDLTDQIITHETFSCN